LKPNSFHFVANFFRCSPTGNAGGALNGRPQGPGRAVRLACALLLIAGAALFLDRASVNARLVNTNLQRTDQGAYLNYAMRLQESDFSYVASRNRMPLYPGLVALGIREGQTREEIFEAAKRWNTWLALGCLAVVAGIFFRSLPVHAAMNATFLSAFTVFLFKAPHVQAEVLYYTLGFVFFVLCWSLFRRPSWAGAVLAGGVAGLAHLTKASIAPAVFCFVVFYCLDALWQRRGTAATGSLHRFALVALVCAGFLTVIFPYISKSKEIYGHYFYNVNSTFYFWCDSWKDAVERTKGAGDRTGWPNLAPEQTPGPANYFRTHSAGDIGARIGSGISRVFKSMTRSYGYFGFVVALAVACAVVAAQKRRLLWRLFRVRPAPALALAAYFCGYALLIIWYSQIISGNRFILALFLPFVFSTFVFLAAFSRDVRLFRLPLWPVFNTVFSIALAAEIAVICLVRIPHLYGGD